MTVNYDTPQSNYSMSITASRGSVAPSGLKKTLSGSGQWWSGCCRSTHVLTIEPTVECVGEAWTVGYLQFKLKGAGIVDVYVDGQMIYTVSCYGCSRPIYMYVD